MSSAKDTFPQIPNYKVLSKISEGGMATVYLASQNNLERKVALKIMSPVFVSDKTLRDSFIKEGKIIASLSHPHIITIHDIGKSEQHYYMTMEYMPGETLKEKITAGLSVEESLMIIEQLAKALGYAHYRDFIHRDVKPGNVLFRHPGHVILTDFGVAKAKKTTSDLTRLGYMVGTPHYMSPEQANGNKIDHRTDLYSLGVLFYEILTQKKPFTADDTMAIAYKHVNEPIPPLPIELHYLQGVLDKLLAKEPQQRFQSAREFINALHQSKTSSTRIMPARRTPAPDKQSKQQAAKDSEHSGGVFSSLKGMFNKNKTEGREASTLERTIRQMQDRQATLENQLQSHQVNTEDLKKQLHVAKRNNREISKKTLSRLNQLDQRVEPQNEKSTKPTAAGTPKSTPVKVTAELEPTERQPEKALELPTIEIDSNSMANPDNKVANKKATHKPASGQPTNKPTKPKTSAEPDFPTLKANPKDSKRPVVTILSPEITGNVKKLVTVEPTSSMLLLGQLSNATLSDEIHINGQRCRTVLDGYFCLKLHLKPKTDTNLSISISNSNEKAFTVTHKLRQLDFGSENKPATYAPTLTSMHNHALVIGNTFYEQFDETQMSTADASRINKLLAEKYQFQTSCLMNATNKDILDSLNAIYTRFNKGDTLIIFYSGLSHLDESADEGYWIPVDGDKDKQDTWLSNRYLSEILQLFPAKHILIFTDSSFSAASKQQIKIKKLLKGKRTSAGMRSSSSSGTVISSGSHAPLKPSIENTRHSVFGGGLINILECADSLVGTKELYSDLKTYSSKFRGDRKNKSKVTYAVLNGHQEKNNNFFLKPSNK